MGDKMKKVIAMIAFCGVVLMILISCSRAENKEPVKNKFDYTYYDGSKMGYPIFYIMHDNENNQDYIIVKNNEGVSITPRLKKDGEQK